ncbi:MAG: putative neutral zinc metallopeptidase [Lentisphaerae bacterium ADurb.BinA184]|nr:MAG: putative neutral zinc metallopeptidase [Lentisphaerae bacterium ADurb.BinA184]
MQWKGRRQSANVEDRRGISGRTVAVGGGLGTLAVALIVMLLGGNPQQVMQTLQNIQATGQGGEQTTRPLTEEEKELGEFVGVILADTEDVWNRLFEQQGLKYREPKLIMFSGATQSGCGHAQSATGPFYCSADESVYIDLDFFQQMQKQLGAPGDFAWAYVIAHEVGHHVQNLLGTLGETHGQMQRLDEKEANRLLVRLELQADFLAGVWAHHAQRMKNLLEEGDIEEGMNAASSVGDDRIMKQQQGYVVPDAFTHGTSEQRVRWFTTGLKTGDLAQGDTFNARTL